MRKCKYELYVQGHNPTEFNRSGNEWVKFTDGVWTGWGVDYEELDGGPGNFTVGIVERPDGSVVLVPAQKITFNVPLDGAL